MKLSIITINYNNLEGLKKTVESVLAQTWRDFEWIIVDGGSTDGSREYIESLAQSLSEGTAIDRVQWNVERFSLPGFTADDLKNPEVALSSNCLSSIANRPSSIDNRSQHLLWCSEPDNGVYDAMNKGIKKAVGEYLNFLNSGDSYVDAGVLQKLFRKERTADIIYGSCIYVKNGVESLKEYPPYVNLHYLLHSGLNHQATFIRRTILSDVLYDTSYKIAADYKFWLQSALSGRKFERYSSPIARYDDSGISSSDPDKTLQEISQIRKVMLSADFLNYEQENYREYQTLNTFPFFLQDFEKWQCHPFACRIMRMISRLMASFLI